MSSYFWQTKEFETHDKFVEWVYNNEHRVQWQEVFINNAYGVQYRKLRKVY